MLIRSLRYLRFGLQLHVLIILSSYYYHASST